MKTLEDYENDYNAELKHRNDRLTAGTQTQEDNDRLKRLHDVMTAQRLIHILRRDGYNPDGTRIDPSYTDLVIERLEAIRADRDARNETDQRIGKAARWRMLIAGRRLQRAETMADHQRQMEAHDAIIAEFQAELDRLEHDMRNPPF